MKEQELIFSERSLKVESDFGVNPWNGAVITAIRGTKLEATPSIDTVSKGAGSFR